jgi:hypothetical protein
MTTLTIRMFDAPYRRGPVCMDTCMEAEARLILSSVALPEEHQRLGDAMAKVRHYRQGCSAAARRTRPNSGSTHGL